MAMCRTVNDLYLFLWDSVCSGFLAYPSLIHLSSIAALTLGLLAGSGSRSDSTNVAAPETKSPDEAVECMSASFSESEISTLGLVKNVIIQLTNYQPLSSVESLSSLFWFSASQLLFRFWADDVIGSDILLAVALGHRWSPLCCSGLLTSSALESWLKQPVSQCLKVSSKNSAILQNADLSGGDQPNQRPPLAGAQTWWLLVYMKMFSGIWCLLWQR